MSDTDRPTLHIPYDVLDEETALDDFLAEHLIVVSVTIPPRKVVR